MRWITQLHTLTERSPEQLQAFAQRPEISYRYSCQNQKGGVYRKTDAEGKLIGLVVHVNGDQSRLEQEVTFLHELFHIVLGVHHPFGHYMMLNMDKLLFLFVEAKLDEASYKYHTLHPQFVQSLFDSLFIADTG